MSVIVKGMEMPQNCAYCPLSGYRNTSLGQILDCKRIGTVGTAVRDTYDVLNRRHPNCPLIELPPHGRLGDLDKLWDRMYNYIDNEGAKMPFGDNDFMIHRDSACELIEDAPTVIEAEGET